MSKIALPGENALDRAIGFVFPSWGANRLRARALMRMYSGAYEAAHPSKFNKWARDYGSGTNVTRWAHYPLKIRARDLERNSDTFRGALSILQRNVVGPHGIQIEPAPKNAQGQVHEELAQAMHRVWRDWCERPETSRSYDYARMQRLKARSWFRDGEFLTQHCMGTIPGLRHGTKLPYSQELIECDLLPVYMDDRSRGIAQGVERNAWLQPVGYWLFKGNPNDYQTLPSDFDIKRVPAQNISHLKLTDRVHQVRGISIAAAVFDTLLDLKDYDDSERIAAKIAASICAIVTQKVPDDWQPPTDGEGNSVDPGRPPEMQMQAGQIFRGQPGDIVQIIGSNRPNSNVDPWRNGQMRKGAAGLEVSYSSLSKNYNGTYSAQRQELVEQWGAYAVLTADFIDMDVRATYQNVMNIAFASGVIDLRKFSGADPDALLDAFYVFPPMPWINPIDEVEAKQMMEEAGYISGPEVIRSRGAHPNDVLQQESSWRKKAQEAGVNLAFDSPALPTPRPVSRERSMKWD